MAMCRSVRVWALTTWSSPGQTYERAVPDRNLGPLHQAQTSEPDYFSTGESAARPLAATPLFSLRLFTASK